MDIDAVCTNLATVVSSISGLKVSPYVPDSVIPPHFFVAEIDVDFDKSMRRGMDELEVTGRLLVSRADDLTGYRKLNEFTSGSGVKSIKAVCEADRGSNPLGGSCDDYVLRRIQSRRLYEHAGQHYIGSEFIFRVIGDGA